MVYGSRVEHEFELHPRLMLENYHSKQSFNLLCAKTASGDLLIIPIDVGLKSNNYYLFSSTFGKLKFYFTLLCLGYSLVEY